MLDQIGVIAGRLRAFQKNTRKHGDNRVNLRGNSCYVFAVKYWSKHSACSGETCLVDHINNTKMCLTKR